MTVPYKTGGSSGLLVRDDTAFSRAWHANVSGSPAPEGRLPGLQIRGRKLQHTDTVVMFCVQHIKIIAVWIETKEFGHCNV